MRGASELWLRLTRVVNSQFDTAGDYGGLNPALSHSTHSGESVSSHFDHTNKLMNPIIGTKKFSASMGESNPTLSHLSVVILTDFPF